MSTLIVGLDNTIVNLALPAIQRDLNAPVTGLQWTIDAYTLVLASLLMLSGSTADRFGRRGTFQVGLAVFGIGSLLCSLAPNIGALIAFRMVQAVGGSMLNPVAMSIVTNTFTEARERAQAIGVWAGVAGLSMALGPVVGGVLVDTGGWQSIFWLNLPICVLAIVLTAVYVPDSKADRPRPLDPVGQVLVIVLLMTSTFAIIEGPGAGWGSSSIIACLVAAAVSGVLLLWYESRRTDPLVDPRFFRSVPFTAATVSAVCGYAGMAGFLFLNALYLQSVRGLTPLQAGLITLPMALPAALFSPVSGRIVAARGPRLPLAVAGVGVAVCGGLLSVLAADTPVWYLVIAYVVFGIGFGLLNAPITNTAVSGMPRSQAGVASGIAATSRQVGVSLGVAILGSVATARVVGPFRTGFPAASHASWLLMAGCGVVVLVLGFLATTRWALRTAAVAAARIAVLEEPRLASV
ncbi:MFS transporter [Kutzneria buriramensis]|nr:MFS transporter [Kutzneria buriramensis]